MARLPNQEFRQMVPVIREPDFYEDEEPRPIHWSKYNESQIKSAIETLTFIRDNVDLCEHNNKKRVGRPLTDPKMLAKAILICEALGFTERESQEWVKIIGPLVGIDKHIDDRVMGEAYDNPQVLYILKQVFDRSKTSDGKLSGDGTGIETSRKQNYESTKKSGAYLTSVVDSREIVQAFDVGTQELHAMHELVEQIKGKSLRLDAGFNDRKLVDKINSLGMTPYVFPKKNNKLNGHQAWKEMYLELYYDVMQWLTEYHQRSHAESFHSSFKRKNKLLLKIRGLAQLSQLTARIILHNRRRLAYFNRLTS
ncbi:MAG: transposase [Candidatus Aenigmarchaeota archaeon]|nr:transposase [Candidatus Aenigmarchaeota archaeon]